MQREFLIFKELAQETHTEARFVEKIVKDHLIMTRTFEQRILVEEDKFINRDGVYMVFDGECGIY